MKNTKFYGVLSLMTSTLLVCHPTFGSGRTSLPTSDQNIIKEAETGNEGARKRVKKRSEGRDIQRKGEELQKTMEKVEKPFSYAGTIVSVGAAASGDPHAKMAAAAFRLSLIAIKELGEGIAKIITITGRYQERSQEILSNAEILLEEIQKSIDKKERLEKSLKELLSVEKSIEPSQSSSRLKQLSKGASAVVKSAEIKVRQATDVITNDKAERGEKIKGIQAELKVENENYAENIRLLQILLLQDTIREIDKKIDLEGTISRLETKIAYNQQVRQGALAEKRAKRKKIIAKLEKDDATDNKDLLYYMKFQKSPTETPEQLQKSRAELQNKSEELTALTKRGDTLYLQSREVDLDSDVNRSAIVGLYKEIDDIKKQLGALGKTAPTKDPAGAPPPPQTAKPQGNTGTSTSKGTAKPLPQTPVSTRKGEIK